MGDVRKVRIDRIEPATVGEALLEDAAAQVRSLFERLRAAADAQGNPDAVIGWDRYGDTHEALMLLRAAELRLRAAAGLAG